MQWIYQNSDPLWQTIAGSILIFIVIILFVRIIGLRSFAKFTAYDFGFTVAIGSIIASILTSSTSVVHGAIAIASLLCITYTVSYLQRKYELIDNIISNDPLLLMDGSKILEENLKHARIGQSQLMAKLREANVLQLNQVHYVVLESTGDISVLHSNDNVGKTDAEILDGVRMKP